MLRRNIKIDRDAMDLISLFNNISGAIIKDCLTFKNPDNNSEVIIFLVKEQDIGKAIGKAGEHVKDLKSKLNKKVDVIAFSENLNKFIQNILQTTKNSILIQNIEVKESRNQKKTVIITVRPQDRGKAIGKEGSMIRKIKVLVLRYFEVDNVIINTKNI